MIQKESQDLGTSVSGSAAERQPLRAPQPWVSTSDLSKPPQYNPKQLNAPQPPNYVPPPSTISLVRTTARIRNNTNRQKNNSSRRFHPRRDSNTSKRSRGNISAASSSNTNEPENDVGSQPLVRNVVRKPDLVVPSAATANPTGSVSTASTHEGSFEQSESSHHGPLHARSNASFEEMLRRKTQKHNLVTRTAKTSFTGNITATTRPRRNATNNNSNTSDEQQSVMDGTGTSGDLSLVASVVDEAALEAEFEMRIKSRMVEAVEIVPASNNSNEEYSRIYHTTNSSIRNKLRNIYNSRSTITKTDHDDESGSRTNPTFRELARQKQKSETIRYIVAWVPFVIVAAVLVALLVVISRSGKPIRVDQHSEYLRFVTPTTNLIPTEFITPSVDNDFFLPRDD